MLVQFTRRLSLLSAFLLGVFTLSAQCEYEGMVASFDPDCSIQVLDLETGMLFEPINAAAYELEEGMSIWYSREILNEAVDCPSAAAKIELLCVFEDTGNPGGGGGEPVDSCGNYMTSLYSDGSNLHITLYSVTDETELVSVTWTDPATGNIVGMEETLIMPISMLSACDVICATYTVAFPGSGETCTMELCEPIFAGDTCFNPFLFAPETICTTDYTPVCGCDGVTYSNACVAQYQNGIMTFTVGECDGGGGGNNEECAPNFVYTSSDDIFTFTSTSTGNYDDFVWTFSDGLTVFSTNPLSINPPQEGFVTVCLTLISNNQMGCNATYCEEVFLGLQGQECNYTDCVYPGDANGDGLANIYDVLNIGLGYETTGPIRENASIEWTGQYAPNWNFETAEGVNYKHLDCDGDGFISMLDQDAIVENYTPEQQVYTPTMTGAPLLYLEFNTDTIIFENGGPSEYTFHADIMLGNANNSILDLHGLAFWMNYPQDLVAPHTVNITYDINEPTFGEEEDVLWMSQDIFELGRNDYALSRKSGNTTNTYGKIGTAEFVIVIDVLVGRAETETPFIVELDGVKMIDGAGNPIDFNLPEELAQILIIDNTVNNTENILDYPVEIFPNPATDVLQLNFGDLQVEQLELYNAVGQMTVQMPVKSAQKTLNISDLERGIYVVKLYAEEGIVTRKILLE